MPSLLKLVIPLVWCAFVAVHTFAASGVVDSRIITLEERVAKANSTPRELAKFEKDVFSLIESGGVTSGEEFFRVSNLAAFGLAGEFRKNRTSYELLLAAVAKDYGEAASQLPQTWDVLMYSLGRPIRMRWGFGVVRTEGMHDYPADFAPDVVQAVWRDPRKVTAIASSSVSNRELQSLVDGDQTARSRDWSKFSAQELQSLHDTEVGRNARTWAIVESGELRTAADFANAALIMQHSTRFDGFRLAHELAVCSLLLGNRKEGRWLVAATYDRMLNSMGHDQRFGTQYLEDGVLVEIDRSGICEEERLALECRLDANRPNKAPEPTVRAVTSPAAQEPRQP